MYKLALICSILTAGAGLFVTSPAKAASFQMVTNNWGTNGLNTRVNMAIYVPDNMVTNPPIVLCLHHCGGWGALSFAENPDLVAAADQYGFIIIFPSALNSDGSNGRCWDNGSPATLTRYGGADSEAVLRMVNYTITNYHANAARVYAQGGSSGAMMVETMLGVYPEMFKAGVGFAGVTCGASGWWTGSRSAQEWGDLVRAIYPGYTGRRPRIQLWHGTADPVVGYNNLVESTKQYSNLLGLSPTPTLTTTQMLFSITNPFVHQVWQNPCGDTLIDAWSEVGGDHGSGAWKAVMYLSFLGLDVVGPNDPLEPCNVVPVNSQIEAENFDAVAGGIQIENCSEGGQNLTNLQNGSYVVFKHVDFGINAANFLARVASGADGGNIELHLDSRTGVQVGTCAVTNTGGWQTWATRAFPIARVTGVHDLYLKFTGGSGARFNLNWLRFHSVAAGDVGAVGVSGATSYGSGVYTVTGAGSDIQGTADAFHFAYVTVTNNCTIIARCSSVPNVNPWSKAGVMIRESLNAGAANAFIAVTPSNGVTWQFRASTGGATTWNNTSGLTAPYWVKLSRNGNNFTASRSPNGVSWTPQGSATIPMAATVYVGLAVTSHDNANLCAATFDQVSAPGWLEPLTPAPTGLAATAASSSQVQLTWNPVAAATSYRVKRAATSGGPYTTIAAGLTVTNFSDAAASVGSGSYYVVSAIVGGVETPNSAQATASFSQLTGAIIGTAGSWNNSGNTIAKVFDHDLNTFFDAPAGNGAWVGLDFGVGVSNVIKELRYCPRAGFESRMVGGVFQGANLANFAGAVTLRSVATAPSAGLFTAATISNATAFRYVRYLAPNDGWGNVAELEFDGYRVAPPVAPLLRVALTGTNLTLVWPMASAGFILQSRTNLASGAWEIVASPAPQVFGAEWQVTVPPAGPDAARFYRLSN